MLGETGLIDLLTKGWTPGAVGIWLILGSILVGMWKGLPAVLDAWSNSQAKERAHRDEQIKAERDHREKEIERLERQIKSADDRHEECMTGQKKLRDEIASMQIAHASEINRLQGLISGMVMQMRQVQLSAGRVVPSMPDEYSAMIDRMGREDQ